MSQRNEFLARVSKVVYFSLRNHSDHEQLAQLRSRPMAAKAIAARARRQIIFGRTQATLVALDDMIDFPGAIRPLGTIAALSETDRITAKMAVSVSLFPDLTQLYFSHASRSL